MNSLNIEKSIDILNPQHIVDAGYEITCIGCGALGGYILQILAKMGVKKITIYDFDVVEAKNKANQVFTMKHVGMKKTDAMKEIMLENNEGMIITTKGKYEGLRNQTISGILFVAVDSAEMRRVIAKNNEFNKNIKLVIDSGMDRYDGVVTTVDWECRDSVEAYIDGLLSTSDEAVDQRSQDLYGDTTSVCRMEQSLVPNVMNIAGIAVTQLIKFVYDKPYSKYIYSNIYDHITSSL